MREYHDSGLDSKLDSLQYFLAVEGTFNPRVLMDIYEPSKFLFIDKPKKTKISKTKSRMLQRLGRKEMNKEQEGIHSLFHASELVKTYKMETENNERYFKQFTWMAILTG
jgi:hypothetical protein